ncbi:ATP-binding protein [Microbacterium sp. Leaf320]|uniref:ATP-binding protein n=1 Tax=Microbacterium sp. Leaf320 TaxID=1736334 RepID=UPI001910974F|nr:ATP-binding protein [Microbacterium sp. Leaf320]
MTAELDPELAGISPVHEGEIRTIGQVGSLVLIPQGMVDLVAMVESVGLSELSPSDRMPIPFVAAGRRWLRLQVIGEVDRGTRQFTRGIANYPALGDQVHLSSTDDISALFPRSGELRIEIGHLSTAKSVPVTLDVGKLVLRHSAVVGSTGSGKTSVVAALLQRFSNADWPGANVIVIDSHGEYRNTLDEGMSVRSVLGRDQEALPVPFWALPATEILRVFSGVTASATTQKSFANIVEDERREFLAQCDWLDLPRAAVTADTPVPFDLNRAWLRLDSENRETRTDKGDPRTACVISVGDSSTLTPTEYEPNGPGSTPPHQATTYGTHGSVPAALRLGLLDPRLGFMRSTGAETKQDTLAEAIRAWVGGSSPVSVLDFSGVANHVAELAISVVLKLLFETATRSRPSEDSVGRSRPVLVVIEEAHRYLGNDSLEAAKDAVNRIAREGRKYGIGLMLVTQRPSELPDTTLSQCGTLIALRLSNSTDQGRIRQALPDEMRSTTDALSSLRVGEAIVSGEASSFPARVILNTPAPWPRAEDPDISSWRSENSFPDVELALERWRGIYNEEKRKE